MTSSPRWMWPGRSTCSAACATPPRPRTPAPRAAPPIWRPSISPLQAELATDYFTLRGDDATVRLLEDSVAQFDTAWEQTRRRYDTGVAAATDVDQADTLRQNARSQLAATRLARARLEHAIAVLLGLPPSAFSLPPAPLAAEPPSISVALPSVLLERRPDVASAEREVAAANAGIGVARAAWFPVFSLQAAAAGFESVAAANWIGAPSRFWAVGPGGQLPLLDVGGRSRPERAGPRRVR